jgi:hypothetical protein
VKERRQDRQRSVFIIWPDQVLTGMQDLVALS